MNQAHKAAVEKWARTKYGLTVEQSTGVTMPMIDQVEIWRESNGLLPPTCPLVSGYLRDLIKKGSIK